MWRIENCFVFVMCRVFLVVFNTGQKARNWSSSSCLFSSSLFFNSCVMCVSLKLDVATTMLDGRDAKVSWATARCDVKERTRSSSLFFLVSKQIFYTLHFVHKINFEDKVYSREDYSSFLSFPYFVLVNIDPIFIVIIIFEQLSVTLIMKVFLFNFVSTNFSK